MPLTDIVNVSVSLQRAKLAAAGFGRPLIVGPCAGASGMSNGDFAIYSSLEGMEADGFSDSDPEYNMAETLLAQDNRVTDFIVGKSADVAQVDTVTIGNASVGDTYTVTISNPNADDTSETYSYTADTGDNAAAIGTALAALINADTNHVNVSATGSTNFTLTSTVAGDSFTTEVDVIHASGGTGAISVDNETTENFGREDALSAFANGGAAWYCTLDISRDPLKLVHGSKWCETHTVPPHIFVAQTAEADSKDEALSEDGDDLANKFAALNRKRTSLWWHSDDNKFVDAAVAGRELPLDPGTENWALKELRNVSADDLTETEKDHLQGSTPRSSKNANIYYALLPGGKNPITSRGTMSSGDWIDVIRFIDFLQARMSEAVANLFLSKEKVEFDESGLELIAAQIRGVLAAAKAARKVTEYDVQVPAMADISSSDRSMRILNPPIKFTAQLSGAFNFAQITGTVVE